MGGLIAGYVFLVSYVLGMLWVIYADPRDLGIVLAIAVLLVIGYVGFRYRKRERE